MWVLNVKAVYFFRRKDGATLSFSPLGSFETRSRTYHHGIKSKETISKLRHLTTVPSSTRAFADGSSVETKRRTKEERVSLRSLFCLLLVRAREACEKNATDLSRERWQTSRDSNTSNQTRPIELGSSVRSSGDKMLVGDWRGGEGKGNSQREYGIGLRSCLSRLTVDERHGDSVLCEEGGKRKRDEGQSKNCKLQAGRLRTLSELSDVSSVL